MTDATPGGMPAYRMSLAVTFVTKAHWLAIKHFLGEEALSASCLSAIQPLRPTTDMQAIQTSDELGDCPEKEKSAVGKSLSHRSGLLKLLSFISSSLLLFFSSSLLLFFSFSLLLFFSFSLLLFFSSHTHTPSLPLFPCFDVNLSLHFFFSYLLWRLQ